MKTVKLDPIKHRDVDVKFSIQVPSYTEDGAPISNDTGSPAFKYGERMRKLRKSDA